MPAVVHVIMHDMSTAECSKLAPDGDIVACQRRLLGLCAAPKGAEGRRRAPKGAEGCRRAPKALAVAARQRPWRGPSCQPVTCHSATFPHAGRP